MTEERMKALHLSQDGLISASQVIEYTVSVIQRERERLAEIFKFYNMSELATAIVDKTNDDAVFRFK